MSFNVNDAFAILSRHANDLVASGTRINGFMKLMMLEKAVDRRLIQDAIDQWEESVANHRIEMQEVLVQKWEGPIPIEDEREICNRGISEVWHDIMDREPGVN